MTSLTLTPRSSARKEGFLTSDIRACIAKHLGVDVEFISDESHFTDDLGLDWLDIIELIILLEERFADGRVTDEAEIEFVGDLINHIESSNHARSS
jgi:acyl carrier protein